MQAQRVLLLAALAGAVAGCAVFHRTPSSRLSREFRTTEVRSVAIVLDAGDQSRVPADNALNMLRLMLLCRGYRPFSLSPGRASDLSARRLGADAVLSVNLGFQWQAVTEKRGWPVYDYVIEVPRVSVAASMHRTSDGRTLLNGSFAKGGLDLRTGGPPAVVEDEWRLVLEGLTATLAALPIRAAALDSSVRQVNATVAADEEYRRAEGWERQATGRVEGGSRILETELGLALAVRGPIRPWVSADEPHRLPEHLASLERQVPPDGAEIVIGLTAQQGIVPDSSHGVPAGVSQPFGRAVLVRQGEPLAGLPELARVMESAAIAREVSHLFGAIPTKGAASGDVLGFDDRTRRIVALTRGRSFEAGDVLHVDAKPLVEIYRSAGAEGLRFLGIVEGGHVPDR